MTSDKADSFPGAATRDVLPGVRLAVIYRLRLVRGRAAATRGIGATLVAEKKAQRIFPAPLRSPSRAVPEFWAVRVADEKEARSTLELLADDSQVERAYIAPPRYLAPVRRASVTGGPSHPSLNLSWRKQVRLNEAQRLAQWRASAKVSVAVVDSGVDATHPALTHVSASEHHDSPPSQPDPLGHGTHVTGLIASQSNGGWFSEGVASSIADVTVHRALGHVYDPLAYYRALRVAANSSRVMNLSISGSEEDEVETGEITAALQRGVVVVAAMGNEAEFSDVQAFPASIPDVIAVGAVDDSGKYAPFSNRGGNICIAAPGVDVGSTVPTYPIPTINHLATPPGDNMTGTSMACPIVAGVITRMLSYRPQLSPQEVRLALRGDPCGNSADEVGVGVIDAEATLANL